MATRLHDSEFDTEDRRLLGEVLYQRTYIAGPGATIAGLGLSQGTALPDVATAEITGAWLSRANIADPRTGKKVWINVARVVARELVAGA